MAAAAVVIALAVLLAVAPPELSGQARLAFFAFGTATIAWAATRLDPAFVALAAAAFLAVTGAVPQDGFLSSLGADIVWLMIGAFVLGEAIAATGLATRLARFVTARARRTDQIFWLVSAVLLPLTAVIPSTSGRAAVALPLHRSLASALGDAEAARALALLMPIVILVTTIAALTGAGSHLIANDLLAGMGGQRISFLEWMIYGLPFALVAGALSCLVVLRLFLTPEQRTRELAVPTGESAAWSRNERVVALIAALMIGFWLTESWHGLRIATVAVLGALALVSPWGVIAWKDAVKAVSWDLVLFVGAALMIGKALMDTGAAGWLTQALFSAAGFTKDMSVFGVVFGVAAITLTAHLTMTSHAARAAAVVPPLVMLSQTLDMDAAAMVFIGTVGMNYCLTLPVSSKALLMFQNMDGGIRPPDLLRLSAVLGPLHLVLMVAFYAGYWRWVGCAL